MGECKRCGKDTDQLELDENDGFCYECYFTPQTGE